MDTAQGQDGKSSYVTRHWRGQLRLPVSYWLNYVLLSFVLALLAGAIALAVNLFLSPVASSSIRVAVWTLLVAIYVWQVVGAWRSAGNYSRTHPGKHWGTVAKVVLVIAGVSGGIALVGQTANQATTLVQIVFGTGSAPGENAVAANGGPRSRADAILAGVPLFAAVRNIHPPAYAGMIDEMVNASRDGAPQEIPPQVYSWARFTAQERLPRTSDAALLAFHRAMMEELEHLRRQDPAACYDHAYYLDNAPRRLLPQDLLDREEQASTDVLRSYSYLQEVPDQADVQPQIDAVFERLRAVHGDYQAATSNMQPETPEQKAKACEVVIELRRQFLQLPEADAIRVLRVFYSN
jgi:hypothetical protein